MSSGVFIASSLVVLLCFVNTGMSSWFWMVRFCKVRSFGKYDKRIVKHVQDSRMETEM